MYVFLSFLSVSVCVIINFHHRSIALVITTSHSVKSQVRHETQQTHHINDIHDPHETSSFVLLKIFLDFLDYFHSLMCSYCDIENSIYFFCCLEMSPYEIIIDRHIILLFVVFGCWHIRCACLKSSLVIAFTIYLSTLFSFFILFEQYTRYLL